MGSDLSRFIRYMSQWYLPASYHDGDLDRVSSLIVAYPIDVKMGLRFERERAQLEPLLNANDVEDIIMAEVMLINCVRVVRSYLTCAEDDGAALCMNNLYVSTPDTGVRRIIIDMIYDADIEENTTVQISEFRHAVAYVNRLHKYKFICLMLLPISFIESGGWYVPQPTGLLTLRLGQFFTSLVKKFKDIYERIDSCVCFTLVSIL